MLDGAWCGVACGLEGEGEAMSGWCWHLHDITLTCCHPYRLGVATALLSRACYAVESPSAHLPVELWIEAHVVVDGQERLVVLLLQSSLIYYCTWAMM